MSEEEKRNLTKAMYLEVQQIFKEEFAELKDYLQERFVCSKHCQDREANIDKKFMWVFFGLVAIGVISGSDKILPLLAKAIVGV